MRRPPNLWQRYDLEYIYETQLSTAQLQISTLLYHTHTEKYKYIALLSCTWINNSQKHPQKNAEYPLTH